jgi:hypothetical protein
MSVERFDRVARLLAQGTSRRQLLKGFAAGLGASLFSTFGFGSVPSFTNVAHAAGEGDSFLPFIITNTPKGPSICAVASDCEHKVNCSSTREDCRCIESAEGDIRCGSVPSCSAQRCTTSADCADLGKGYFCDSVGSGCCGDDEQRCIPPCETEAPCPEELLCGATCCPPNNTCQNGVCVDPVEGTWTGTLTYEQQSIGIRFILSQKIGALEGRMLMLDPVSQEYKETGPLVDSRYNEGFSTFFLESGSYAFGDFTGDSYEGEFTFASFNGEESLTAILTLQRG